MLCCTSDKPFRSILPDDCQLQEGDVVFRRGGGFTSHVVLAADADGNYSHLGIVVDSAGVKMVVHAVPGEYDFEGDVDRVKMDEPNHFFSAEFATIGEVCRPRDATIAHKAAEAAMELYHKGILFDHNYDDSDTTKMYCTELVVYAFRKAGYDLVGQKRHTVDLPIVKAACIFPSDVHSSSFLKSIYMFNK